MQQPELPTPGTELWGKKPPLSFEKNVGQLNSDVAYWARIGAGSVFLKTTEAAFVLRKAKSAHAARSFRMSWVGANRSASCEGEDELPGKANYFLGKDPSKWRQNVATYRKVRCRGVYPGVDLVFRGDEHQLEYDFVVAPSADPHRIALSFEGVDGLDIDADGQLVLRLAGWRVVHRRPVLYQEFGNFRREVAGAFQRVGSNRVTFQLGRYDRNRALVIDPTLIFSTYLGGLGANDIGSGIAVDALGYVYVTGITDSTDFPTLSAFQPVANGQTQFDAFVSKLSPEGALVFSTYFGGTGIDEARAIAVDGTGAVYLSGGTTSADFPTANPFQQRFGGVVDAFVAKLDSSGAVLLYSSYLGGSDRDAGYGLAVDNVGNVFIVGSTASANFPTQTPLQSSKRGTIDGFVAKLNPSGTALQFATYLGGAGNEEVSSVSVDDNGSAYLAGATHSDDFPLANALQPSRAGAQDAFAAKLNSAGAALEYSTYLGGAGNDLALGISVDRNGSAYLTGATASANFPTANPIQASFGGGSGSSFGGDVFVSKLASSGSALVYSTYVGGSADEAGFGIAVDSAGNAYVTGGTSSTNFPLANPLQATYGGGIQDAFITKLNAGGTALPFSTYLGGASGAYSEVGRSIAVSDAGDVYVAGVTSATNFPTVNPAQSSLAGTQDVFLVRLGVDEPGGGGDGGMVDGGAPDSGQGVDGGVHAESPPSGCGCDSGVRGVQLTLLLVLAFCRRRSNRRYSRLRHCQRLIPSASLEGDGSDVLR